MVPKAVLYFRSVLHTEKSHQFRLYLPVLAHDPQSYLLLWSITASTIPDDKYESQVLPNPSHQVTDCFIQHHNSYHSHLFRTLAYMYTVLVLSWAVKVIAVLS